MSSALSIRESGETPYIPCQIGMGKYIMLTPQSQIERIVSSLHDKENYPGQIRHTADSQLKLRFEKIDVECSKTIYLVKTERCDPLFGKEAMATFLKIPVCETEASSILECLMWKISKLMEVKEFFVPTKVVKLENMEEEVSIHAIMQPAVAGKTLLEIENDGCYDIPQLDQFELAKAILISIVYGMFDAHSANLIITPESKIRFVDNAQSLPNSNGFIACCIGYDIRSSYRCALLDLDKARKPMSEDLKEKLLEQLMRLRQCADKLPEAFPAFFDKLRKKGFSGDFPKFWMTEKSVIESMKERLDLAEKALSSNSPMTLIDFASRSNPRYALAFGLEALGRFEYYRHERKNYYDMARHFHSLLSSEFASVRLQRLVDNGTDLPKIMALSEQAPDFETYINRLVEYYVDFKKQAKIPSTNHIQVIESIRSGILFDLKEESARSSQQCDVIQFNTGMFEQLNIPNMLLPEESFELFNIPHSEFILFTMGTQDVFYAYRTQYGLLRRKIHIGLKNGSLYILHDNKYKELEIGRKSVDEMKSLDLEECSIFPYHPPKEDVIDLFKYGNRVQFTFGDKVMAVHRVTSSRITNESRFDCDNSKNEVFLNKDKPIPFKEAMKLFEAQFLSSPD